MVNRRLGMNEKFYSLPAEKRQRIINTDTMEEGFTRLLDFWKNVYLRK